MPFLCINNEAPPIPNRAAPTRRENITASEVVVSNPNNPSVHKGAIKRGIAKTKSITKCAINQYLREVGTFCMGNEVMLV